MTDETRVMLALDDYRKEILRGNQKEEPRAFSRLQEAIRQFGLAQYEQGIYDGSDDE